MSQYQFKKREVDMEYKDNNHVRSFYQICGIKTDDGQIWVRKWKINGEMDILDKVDRLFDRDKVKRFMKESGKANFCRYMVSCPAHLPMPTEDQIAQSHSLLAN